LFSRNTFILTFELFNLTAKLSLENESSSILWSHDHSLKAGIRMYPKTKQSMEDYQWDSCSETQELQWKKCRWKLRKTVSI